MENANFTTQQPKPQINGHYNHIAANDNLLSDAAENSKSIKRLTWQGENLYLLQEDISALTLIDQINRCLAQASSMATLMIGDDFNTWSTGVISAYGETIMDRIDEAHVLANQLWEKHRRFIYPNNAIK